MALRVWIPSVVVVLVVLVVVVDQRSLKLGADMTPHLQWVGLGSWCRESLAQEAGLCY